MSLKSSFATVLKTLRSKRNISQRNFGDTSRTYLSKLEGGHCSITLDKLDQLSQRAGAESIDNVGTHLEPGVWQTCSRAH